MKKSKYHIIGVMSGTSLDGIDIAEIEFQIVSELQENPSVVKNKEESQKPGEYKWEFKIVHAETIPYSVFWKKKLRNAINFSQEQLERLDFKYTEKLSEDIRGFINRNNVQEIDAICSHGHTVLHQPEKGFTLQIGNLPRLAKLISQTVVCDFRTQDVKLGGQGAPLVPIGDRLLFSEFDYCLNLGGFANISSENMGNRIAYDVCPANIVLNHFAEKLGKYYDEGGNLARKGILNLELLKKLSALSYYAEKPPKSLGLEWVNENIFSLLESFDDSSEDILCTFTEHIATQLSNQFIDNSSVLVTGGGAYNSFLMERIQNLSLSQIFIPSPEIIEYKEALIFGLLGVLKLRDEINCLSSVTGAENDHSSGHVYTP